MSRALLKLILHHLHECAAFTGNKEVSNLCVEIDKELAKPDPDPVEYRYEWYGKRTGVVPNKIGLTEEDFASGRWKEIPLYAEPPASDREKQLEAINAELVEALTSIRDKIASSEYIYAMKSCDSALAKAKGRK